MKTKWSCFGVPVVLLLMAVCLPSSSLAEEANNSPQAWREKAVEYAHILSGVKLTPVASGVPMRGGGYSLNGTEYTGVPYSSVKAVGRCKSAKNALPAKRSCPQIWRSSSRPSSAASPGRLTPNGTSSSW